MHLRQDCVFELRGVGDESVESCYATHGSIQMFKQFAGDACGNLSTVTKRKRIFMSDNDFAGFHYCRYDRLPVVRLKAPQIDDFHADALLFSLFGGNY